jgi:phasin family protein
MSKPAVNPFMESEFTKYFDVSKVMEMPKAFQDMKMPNGFGMENMMEAQRKNMQACVAATQMAMEGMQQMMRRQSESMRQSMKECSGMMNEIMSAGTPEEKFMRQAEMTKSMVDRAMICCKEIGEMSTQSQYDSMQVMSKRMSEWVDEMRSMCSRGVCSASASGKMPANK